MRGVGLQHSSKRCSILGMRQTESGAPKVDSAVALYERRHGAGSAARHTPIALILAAYRHVTSVVPCFRPDGLPVWPEWIHRAAKLTCPTNWRFVDASGGPVDLDEAAANRVHGVGVVIESWPEWRSFVPSPSPWEDYISAIPDLAVLFEKYDAIREFWVAYLGAPTKALETARAVVAAHRRSPLLPLDVSLAGIDPRVHACGLAYETLLGQSYAAVERDEAERNRRDERIGRKPDAEEWLFCLGVSIACQATGEPESPNATDLADLLLIAGVRKDPRDRLVRACKTRFSRKRRELQKVDPHGELSALFAQRMAR
jgi:hypothetical protein